MPAYAENPRFSTIPDTGNEADRAQYLEASNPSYEELLAIHGLRLDADTDPTPTPDLYTEYDRTNREIIDRMIERAGSDRLSEREESGREFMLKNPQILALIKLDNRPAIPDVDVGVIGAGGVPIAIIYNHDMDCMGDPLRSAGLTGDTILTDGPNSGTLFDPGVAQIQTTGVVAGTRLDEVTVQRLIDSYSVRINGVEINLPVLVVKEFALGGESYYCPTITERAGGALGGLTERAGAFISDVDLQEIFEKVGEALGSVLGNFAQGAGRGLRGALDD